MSRSRFVKRRNFMPSEYEFMKSASEKQMSDDEYKTIREEYDKKANELSEMIKKVLIAFFAVFIISFVLLYLISLLNSERDYGNGIGNYTWLAVEVLLLVFLYDPKAEENKKFKYETDKKILLNSVKARIKMNKIKLGLVIGLGAVFLFLNIMCWWLAVYSIMESDAQSTNYLQIFFELYKIL